MEQAFSQWDLDQDQVISYQDIQLALAQAGLPNSHQDVQDMIKGLDPDHTGSITLQAFKLACLRKAAKAPHQRTDDAATALDRELHKKKQDTEQ